jgi:hypothetical protein
MRIIFFFILILCVGITRGGCQEVVGDSTVVGFVAKAHYGMILPHTRDIAALARASSPWGIQGEIFRLRYTKSSWNTCNCFSRNGIALSYFDFDNSAVLGRSVNLILFAEPQLTYGNINLSFRAGMGLSYLTRVYHALNNPENLFVSRPLSGILLVELNNTFWLSERWAIRIGTSYQHISNGGMRQPNKGINFPTISLGTEYTVDPPPVKPRRKNPLLDRTLQYYAGLSYSTRSIEEYNTQDRERKVVIGLQVGFYKPFVAMHAVGLAIEATHDEALKRLVNVIPGVTDHRIVSGLIRHHFLFGRFDFAQALGFYFFKRYPSPEKVFQRYTIDYRILQHIRLGFSLKAHLAVAEQMDVRCLVMF